MILKIERIRDSPQSSTSAGWRVSISPPRSGKGRDQPWRPITLDLEAVDLVDIEAIRFLSAWLTLYPGVYV